MRRAATQEGKCNAQTKRDERTQCTYKYIVFVVNVLVHPELNSGSFVRKPKDLVQIFPNKFDFCSSYVIVISKFIKYTKYAINATTANSSCLHRIQFRSNVKLPKIIALHSPYLLSTDACIVRAIELAKIHPFLLVFCVYFSNYVRA